MDKFAFKLQLLKMGVKQYDIAKKLGLDPARLSSFVNGHRETPHQDAIAISKAMNLPLSKLFPELKGVKTE